MLWHESVDSDVMLDVLFSIESAPFSVIIIIINLSHLCLESICCCFFPIKEIVTEPCQCFFGHNAVMLLSGINLIIYSLLQFPRLPDKALAN